MILTEEFMERYTLILNGFGDDFLNIPFRTPQLHLLQLSPSRS